MAWCRRVGAQHAAPLQPRDYPFPSLFLLLIRTRARVEIYIALRYSYIVAKEITTAEYQALAELRYLIRKFVREGDAVARSAGLEPQQYLLLLAIRGLPEGEEATIRELADRLALKHHSTVELIDRLETHGYVRRNRSRDDRRRVLVSLLPRGEKLLEQVARHRISELRSSGAALVDAIGALLENGRPPLAGKQNRKSARGSKETRGE
jgi:DNA-binding MarR family transcriptional regulator